MLRKNTRLEVNKIMGQFYQSSDVYDEENEINFFKKLYEGKECASSHLWKKFLFRGLLMREYPELYMKAYPSEDSNNNYVKTLLINYINAYIFSHTDKMFAPISKECMFFLKDCVFRLSNTMHFPIPDDYKEQLAQIIKNYNEQQTAIKQKIHHSPSHFFSKGIIAGAALGGLYLCFTKVPSLNS